MLAAFYALTHDEIGHAKRDPMDLMAFVHKHITEIQQNTEEIESDEDTVIEGILSHIEMQLNINSVAQLIDQAVTNAGVETGKSAHLTLQKIGLHIAFSPDHKPIYLHIYPGSKYLKAIFRDTHLYNFAPQLKRHPLAVSTRGFNVKFAGVTLRGIRFNYNDFYERYLKEDDEDESYPSGDRPHAA